MAELIEVFKSFVSKSNIQWGKIQDADKEKFFFIFNRYLSKKYPEKSKLLNFKNIDKVYALDLWYNFMLSEPYPGWFWSKSESKEKSKLPEKDLNLLRMKLRIKKEDIEYLIENNFYFIKEELDFYKKVEKQ